MALSILKVKKESFFSVLRREIAKFNFYLSSKEIAIS
jgi:hypothetical protein